METHLSKRSVEKLFELALTTTPTDDQEHPFGWKAIGILQRRGTQKIFKACQRLVQSNIPNERRVVVDVLGQLGWSQKFPYRDETLPILFTLIDTETDSDVLNSVGTALGHLHDPRAIQPLLKLQNHADDQVLYAVVFGLLTHEDPDAIKGLIALSKDSDPLVRDWATFGLGSQIDSDTEAIRQALFERLTDDDDVTRGEAMVGLAKRHDLRAFEPLLTELEKMPQWVIPLEAAEYLKDARLLSVLLRFRARWIDPINWRYSTLQDAIAACWGESRDE